MDTRRLTLSNNNNSKAGNQVNGSNKDEQVTGTAASEKVDAKAGNDVAQGGAGNDRVKGGSGADVIDGGAGSDTVEGGSGNDRLVYRLAENAGATDVYDGGAHTDTLELRLTRAEWMRDDVQTDIAAYLVFLSGSLAPGQSEGQGFTFKAFGLTARRFEKLEVFVDGTAQDPRDETVTARDDSWTTAGEHDVVAGTVLGNDEVPDLVRSVDLVSGPARGSLVLDSNGSFSFNPGNDFNALAQGESADVSFTYRVSDADRDSATAVARIRVTGTNDAPVANADTATTDENSAVTANVLGNDTDVDTSDTRTVTTASIGSGLGSVAVVNNQVEWTPGTAYDSLAVGESAAVQVNYTMRDNHGAEASSRLSITVQGRNDAPVANADTATTDENSAVTANVLGNDTDVDTSDTRTVNSASIGSGLGSVAIVNNQVEWTPGTAYDYLAVGESAAVQINYTMRDNHDAQASSTLSITVQGRNDAPTVAAPLANTFSEEDRPFTIDLLAGAADVDRGAVLKVSNLQEASGKQGWTLNGTQLQIDPHFWDDLKTGDVETLVLNYKVEDQQGATVDQVLTLNVEGFTDLPSLDVEATAGSKVNEVRLRISSQPANNERVVLNFNSLPAGAKVLDAQGALVSSGVNNFIGTHLFTLVLPANSSADADVEIGVSGFRDSGALIGTTAGKIDVRYDVGTVQDAVSFSSNNQGIWASGPAPMIEWHEYVPIVGGVQRVWEDDKWKETDVAPWSTGEISLVSAGVSAAEVKALALAIPQAILTTARNTFFATAYAVDSAVQATYDLAVSTFNSALTTADQIFSGAINGAKQAFDTAVSAVGDAAESAANWAYQAAVDVAVFARDAHITLWGWLGDWVRNDAWNIYNNTVSAAAAVRDAALAVVNWTEQTARDAAQGVYDGAVAAAAWVRDSTKAAAQWVFDEAARVYNEAKQLVLDGATAVFNEAQRVFNETSSALDAIQGETRLDVTAELFGEVGLQIDFVLDSGSVDTEVEYTLSSLLQHNQTTNMLSITPQLVNLTNGDTVAFSTVSPNAQFKAVLLYDIGMNLGVFLDSTLYVSGARIFDISGDANGINLDTTLSTGGMQSDLDFINSVAPTEPLLTQFQVGEIELINLDTREFDQVELPLVGMLTEDILSIEVGFPTVQTEGKAAAYSPDFYREGGLLNVDLSELVGTVMNHVNARLDLSPEIRQALGLPSLYASGTPTGAFNTLVEVAVGMVFDALDGQVSSTPIFLIDANDQTSVELLHANFIPDSVMTNTLNSNTARLGFYTAYGESNDIVRVTIDIDQLVAVIVNKVVEAAAAAATSGGTAQVLQALPDINPLDLTIGLDTILAVMEVPKSEADNIKKYFDLNLGLEAADVDVYSALRFSQEFSLSIDDMSYLVTLEDDTQHLFAASGAGSLNIKNASSHDKNGDGVLGYTMELVPTAMFSNDTEVGLTVGYVLDFLQASLAADLKLPIKELIGVDLPGLGDLSVNLLDLHFGPLLRVQGDLDLASADVFESRFAIDLGSAEVTGSRAIVDDLITVIGTPSAVPV